MQISQIVEHINIIERDIPVQEWRINGVDVWPMIRMQLYFNLFEYTVFESARQNVKTDGIVLRIFRFAADTIGFYASALAGGFKISAGQCDVLFLDDPSYVTIAGKKYQRFCDPIIDDLAHRHGKKSITLSLMRRVIPDTTSNTRFVFGALRLCRIKGALLAKVKPQHDVHLPGIEQYNQYIRSIGNGVQEITASRLIRDILTFEEMAKYYRNILRHMCPTAAFVVSYYDSLHMSFVYACRKMGVPVVELQHGIVGEYHIAYGRWVGVPDSGYNVLPDFFACWDGASADCIAEWGKKVHQGIIFGNKFLEMSVKDAFVEDDGFKRKFLKVQEDLNPEKNILLSMQNKYLITDILIDILRSSPKSFFWWIRIHPMTSEDELKKIHADLRGVTELLYDIEESTKGNLYRIVPHMDVHVTLNSSVVIEAAKFGVPSVICESMGFEYYRELIDSGVAVAVCSAEEAISAIYDVNRVEMNPCDADSDVLYRAVGLI